MILGDEAMKKIKKLVYLVLIIILFIILIWLIFFKDYGKKYFDKEMDVNYAIGNVLVEQEKINKEIEKYSNDLEYTIDNPKVIVNPYKISPMTALIIFSSVNNTSIKVSINDEYNFIMEEDTKHIIPVYGMYSGRVNYITLSDDLGNVKKIDIEIDKAIDVNDLVIDKAVFSNYNDLYFMTSPVGTSASAYDINGNLKWYLTEKYVMDFEWLDNGHFLVGIPEGSVNDRKIGFVEMDYLGKIYNYYVLRNGYDFEFQVLSNGNYMLCGGEEPIFYKHAMIYEIDNTGKFISYVDLYKIFKDIDSEFDDNRLGYKIIRNAFSYNEKTGELIVSLRGLNSIVSINYNTKKLNYIFAPPGIYSDKFDEYMVTLESGRYPLGIHSVMVTSDGLIGFINNGYDRYNGFEVGGIDDVISYKDSYSSMELYRIDSKKASLVWSFDGDKKYFAHQYGSFNIYDGNKLMNFGWVLKDDYRNRSDATLSESEKNTDNTYAKIFEVNDKDEILLEATMEDGKYRIFKHGLYMDKMSNFSYVDSNFYNTMDLSKVEKINTRKISDKLDSAKKYENNISYTKYVIDTDYKFDTYDKVDILLVGKNSNSYIINYKDELKDVEKNININLGHGEYALYIIINGIYYDTYKKVVY